MCFTPFISLATAMLEFIFATLILLYFRKSKVTPFVISLLYLLGIYQLTEMMLCATGDANLWVRAGFVTYSFLPAVGVHFVMTMINSKHRWISWLLYAFPVVFSVVGIFFKDFVEEGVCNTIFVTARTWFYMPDKNPWASAIYGAYYYIFIITAVLIALVSHFKEKNRMRRLYYMMGMMGISLITISPFIFIILLPAYRVSFPSIYCEFALAFAIIGFVASFLDHKYRIFQR